MMKQIVRDQYASKVDQLISLEKVERPVEGWIRTVRKALGMSGPQLARLLGVGKSQASQMERMETEDRITLKQLRRVADVLGCELVYSLTPRNPIQTMVRERARLKARSLVEKVDVQMKLEAQQLTDEQLQRQIDTEVDRLMREMPRDLWEG